MVLQYYYVVPPEQYGDAAVRCLQEGGERVFGVELHHLVDRERTAAPVPLLIQKTVKEIERRGIQVPVYLPVHLSV